MNDTTAEPAAANPVAAKPALSSRQVTRGVIVGGAIFLGVAALCVAVPWCYYRCHHVVLGKASVKGTITKIGARVDGRIKTVQAEIGQHVSKGQVLLQLEDRHFQAAL